ncbi:substrate-binding domain-containing protein [Methanolobus sediminis]|uniref:Substrate-binding domain-containing protein n=1 Tax=Methanolobus sediminis TaxID=3072978 RepID=A0AA51YLV1_9EURY|nr:substrate-binding domain-containing protein [Methanolobus sediminis]WMW24913.1 substrate-binding domain-containing protein [Methanolobus sediminis]
MFKKLFNDEAGVSPIVATLVLVVVAIAGAAAVGTIMGSFSSDVSDQASAGQASDAASTVLRIAGSTTVTPVAELLAEDYMAANPGVRVDVQEGGSDAGISAAKNDLVDIGMASKPVSTVDYPEIETYTIGYSAVVVIANSNLIATPMNFTADSLNSLYASAGTDGAVSITTTGNLTNASSGGTAAVVYQRAEGSGTEETFAKFLGDSTYDFASDKDVDHSKAKGATGNAGVLAAVKADPKGIGFVDYGFAKDVSGITILTPYGYDAVTESNIKDALKGDDTAYPNSQSSPYGLTRPLNFLTHGTPSSLEQSFIDFAMNPGNMDRFTEVGYYARTQIDY